MEPLTLSMALALAPRSRGSLYMSSSPKLTLLSTPNSSNIHVRERLHSGAKGAQRNA